MKNYLKLLKESNKERKIEDFFEKKISCVAKAKYEYVENNDYAVLTLLDELDRLIGEYKLYQFKYFETTEFNFTAKRSQIEIMDVLVKKLYLRFMNSQFDTYLEDYLNSGEDNVLNLNI